MDHNHSLVQAARAHLRPFGFIQMGRSRTWLLDRSWYLVVVEFQPSSWSRGSYLNVGANFLWDPKAHLSFDLGGRVAPFTEVESESQFSDAATSLALQATRESSALCKCLTTFQGVDDALREVRSTRAFYHRSIALGLSGRLLDAATLLKKLRSDQSDGSPEWVQVLCARADDLSAATRSHKHFTDYVHDLVMTHRSLLKLVQLPTPLRPAS